MTANIGLVAKILTVLWILGTTFVMVGSVMSGVTNFRSMDGGLSLLRMPMSRQDEALMERQEQGLFGQQIGTKAIPTSATVVAFSAAAQAQLNIGVSLGIKLFEAFIAAIVRAFLQLLVSLILQIVQKVLSFLDKFTEIFQKILRFLDVTRVAMGFLAFRSLQGPDLGNGNGSGSNSIQANIGSEVKTSRAFAAELVSSSQSTYGTSLRDNRGVITDAVAWLDYMNMQRALQANVLNFAYKGEATVSAEAEFGEGTSNSVDVDGDVDVYRVRDQFADIRNHLANILIGSQCDTTSMSDVLGPFGGFWVESNGCIQEKGSKVFQQLDQRASKVSQVAQKQVSQYEENQPDGCEARSFVRYNGLYPGYSKGNLTNSIVQVANGIQLIQPTLWECEYAKSGKQTIQEISAISAKPTGGDTDLGEVITQYVNQAISNLINGIIQQLRETLGPIIDLISNLQYYLQGIGLRFVSIEIATITRGALRRELNELQDDQDSDTSPNEALNLPAGAGSNRESEIEEEDNSDTTGDGSNPGNNTVGKGEYNDKPNVTVPTNCPSEFGNECYTLKRGEDDYVCVDDPDNPDLEKDGTCDLLYGQEQNDGSRDLFGMSLMGKVMA
jgi:hypothetical protein